MTTILTTRTIENIADIFLWCLDNIKAPVYVRYSKHNHYGVWHKTSTRIDRYMSGLSQRFPVSPAPNDMMYMSFAFIDEGDAMLFALRYGQEPEARNLVLNNGPKHVSVGYVKTDNLYKYLRTGVSTTDHSA